MYDFGFCLIMTWFNCAIFGMIGIFMIVIWILPARYRQRLRNVLKVTDQTNTILWASDLASTNLITQLRLPEGYLTTHYI